MERWRALPGYRGLYEVSDQGRVRSLRKHKIMRLCLNGDGYPKVALYKNGVRHAMPVHQLVLLAFVGPRPIGYEARHYPDRNKTNNRLRNLSWTTHFINQRDRDKHGTNNKGTRHAFAKLDQTKVRAIRRVKSWPYGTLITWARKYQVSNTTIAYVRDGKSWRHL